MIPIIVRPVEDGWKQTGFGPLKAQPSDGKPVTKRVNRDSAWADPTEFVRLYWKCTGIEGEVAELVEAGDSQADLLGAREKYEGE